jgi:hypothetical protein
MAATRGSDLYLEADGSYSKQTRDLVTGATDDAMVAAGDEGSVVALLRRLTFDIDTLKTGLTNGTYQIRTPAIQGTPISAAITSAITTTTRTEIPWLAGRAPDGEEAGYITAIALTIVGDAPGRLLLHDGDTATVVGILPMPGKAEATDVGGVVHSIVSSLPITAGNSLWVTCTAAPDGLYVWATGFENTTAPA